MVMERSEEGDEWKEGRQKEKEMEVVIVCTPYLVIAMLVTTTHSQASVKVGAEPGNETTLYMTGTCHTS